MATTVPVNQRSNMSYNESRSIRGQLDPPEASPRTGWRYVQCTDRQNELRVRRLFLCQLNHPDTLLLLGIDTTTHIAHLRLAAQDGEKRVEQRRRCLVTRAQVLSPSEGPHDQKMPSPLQLDPPCRSVLSSSSRCFRTRRFQAQGDGAVVAIQTAAR